MSDAICLITNCRNSAPSGEAMCAKHRDREGFVPLSVHARIRVTTHDHFPDQAWIRHLKNVGGYRT